MIIDGLYIILLLLYIYIMLCIYIILAAIHGIPIQASPVPHPRHRFHLTLSTTHAAVSSR